SRTFHLSGISTAPSTLGWCTERSSSTRNRSWREGLLKADLPAQLLLPALGHIEFRKHAPIRVRVRLLVVSNDDARNGVNTDRIGGHEPFPGPHLAGRYLDP